MKNPIRLNILRLIVCLAFLAGILFSLELWFPVNRTFPRAPFFFDLSENTVIICERFLCIALIVSLICIIFFRFPKIFSITAIASLILLIFFDQTRLQPWVYQYLLLLVVSALREPSAGEESNSDQTLAFAQIIIAALYFWSGVQKLNFTLSHETLPMLLEPLRNFFPADQSPFVFLGITAALVEALIGVGLLIRKTRNLAVCLACAMHAAVLVLLIAKGHNSIVWIWNAALIALVIVSFWRSDVSLHQAIRKRSGWKVMAAKLITAASVLLPFLSFWGWWDMYLSGALYSGNVETAVIRINDDLFEKLPAKARQSLFQIQSGNQKILPLFEWAMAELNVPPYPERRVFGQVARQVCALPDDKTRIELIVKERPAILDGSYKVTRISCAQLESY